MLKNKSVLIFSSYSNNLRALAVKDSLIKLGYKVNFFILYKNFGNKKELLFNIIPNIIKAIFSKPFLAIGFKPYPSVYLPLFILKMKGVKTILDIDDLEQGYRKKGLLSYLIFLNQFPAVFSCDIITYHNQFLYNYLIEKLKVKKKIIRLIQGVNISLFSPSVLNDEKIHFKYKEKYKKNNKKILIYTAHLNNACNLDSIFNIWLNIHKDFPDYYLLIVGGGELKSYYEKMAKSLKIDGLVVFTDKIVHNHIPYILSLADIALLYLPKDLKANKYRCSLKLREYLAFGIKVVCNDNGELKEFEKYTYQSNDNLENFSNKLRIIMQKGGDGREQIAQKYAENNLSWDIIVSNFMKNIETIRK